MQSLETLWREVRELSLGAAGHVTRLPSPPSPLYFLREFVALNKPCLISNAIPHWPALKTWSSNSYLIDTLYHSDSKLVSLHLTPNGRADAIAPYPNPAANSMCFASAHVERVPIKDALQMVERSGEGFVAYLQQQNDCFRSEFAPLAADCDSDINWATEAFGGAAPDAVNLWIGNEHSETSFHKDHYENLYAVVSGEKHFVLLPPTDVHRMYIRDYPAAHYNYSKENGRFSLELDEPAREVPWCSVNPYPDDLGMEMARFPLYFNGPKPFEVTVKAGEMLYLPSMWFHHVRQSPDSQGRTIAVNYWYDMQFDIKYAYYNFLQSMRFVSTHGSKSREQASANIAESNLEDVVHPDRLVTSFLETF